MPTELITHSLRLLFNLKFTSELLSTSQDTDREVQVTTLFLYRRKAASLFSGSNFLSAITSDEAWRYINNPGTLSPGSSASSAIQWLACVHRLQAAERACDHYLDNSKPCKHIQRHGLQLLSYACVCLPTLPACLASSTCPTVDT